VHNLCLRIMCHKSAWSLWVCESLRLCWGEDGSLWIICDALTDL
jgi:hypothetical protein